MIDIVIVSWNSGQQVADALTSIGEHHDGLVASLVVVDNASTDGSHKSVEAIGARLPFHFELVRNSQNRGFAAACNQGARLGRGELVLFLNPDTRVFDRSLRVPAEFLQQEENRDVGIAGIQLIDEQGQVARSCSRFPSLRIFAARALGIGRLAVGSQLTQAMLEWPHDSTREVDQVIGAFFMLRRSVFEMLGGFDERFFVYFEEVDLSLRARQAGYRSVFIADAQAFHAGGGSSRQVKARRLFYSLRSRLLYGLKHFGPLRSAALMFVTLVIEPLTRAAFSLQRSGWTGARDTLKAFSLLYADLPAILGRSDHDRRGRSA